MKIHFSRRKRYLLFLRTCGTMNLGLPWIQLLTKAYPSTHKWYNLCLKRPVKAAHRFSTEFSSLSFNKFFYFPLYSKWDSFLIHAYTKNVALRVQDLCVCVGGELREDTTVISSQFHLLRSCETRSLIFGVKRQPEVMGVRHYESHVSDLHLVGSCVFLDFMPPQMGILKDFKYIWLKYPFTGKPYVTCHESYLHFIYKKMGHEIYKWTSFHMVKNIFLLSI